MPQRKVDIHLTVWRGHLTIFMPTEFAELVGQLEGTSYLYPTPTRECFFLFPDPRYERADIITAIRELAESQGLAICIVGGE